MVDSRKTADIKTANSDNNRDLKKCINNNNIYDIICYYDEGNSEPHQDKNVTELIKNIEKNTLDKVSKIDNDKKYTNFKLLGCLLINLLLSTPIYVYGTIYIQHKSKFDSNPSLIWPPIIYNSIYLIVTPWLFNTTSSSSPSTPSSTTSNTSKYHMRSTMIIFTLALSFGISVCGLLMIFSIYNFFVMILFYSIIGGMSSCILMGKLFIMIKTILNSDKMHLVNFVYSAGQALSQLSCPLLLNFVLNKICTHGALLIMGALILHIIPISMLIVRDKIKIELRVKVPNAMDENAVAITNESRYSDISQISFEFKEIKYPSDLFEMDANWKNPCDFNSDEDETSEGGGATVHDDFMQVFDSSRVMNAEGVEIMQIIVEENEEEFEYQSSSSSSNQINDIYDEINKIHDQKQQEQKTYKNLRRIIFLKNYGISKFQKFKTTLYKQIFNPMRRSIKLFKFFPSIILKSVDIFSYLLFITLILPNLALINFNDKSNVIVLISVMAAFWLLYAVLNLRFYKRLKEKQHYWHILGILGKFFGYLFTNQRYSFNGFVFGLALISVGHANSFHLQEIMIRQEFHPRKWYYVRGSIYSFSGVLVIVYSISFHILYINLSLVTFCNIFVIFNLCGLLFWIFTHYRVLVQLFIRY